MTAKTRLTESFNGARGWLSNRLAANDAKGSKSTRARKVFICAVIFLIALGVRLLCWQDNRAGFLSGTSGLQGLAFFYHDEARRILDDGGLLFPRGDVDAGDAGMIIHPPGYSILMTSLTKMSNQPNTKLKLAQADTWLRQIQIICDGAACVLVFFIAAELLPVAVAIIAALIAALSPHLAYYSLLVSPDSLSALMILLAVYSILIAIKRKQLFAVAAAGLFVGLSCWLRSNALLLAPFLALVTLFLVDRGKRLLYGAALVCATVLIIAPITIRNWAVYRQFIPLSLGAGITLIQGIADQDEENRFGMPANDTATLAKDVEWHGRADYAKDLWSPDGIERDRARLGRGLEIIKSNPGWFLGAMIGRMDFMLRYNDFSQPISRITTVVPTVLPTPNFGHALTFSKDLTPAWIGLPSEMMASGETLSPQTTASLTNDQALEISGEVGAYGDQFSVAPVAIKDYTDYLLRVPVNLSEGRAALRLKTADPRVLLASVGVPEPEKRDSIGEQPITMLQVPFASAASREIRIVFGNNDPARSQTKVQIGRAELFELGPTPHLWTRYPRALIRGIQKNLFKTGNMRLLIAAGILLLALARRKNALLALMAVPAYYLLVQSLVHTEYRYVLVIHYFLFVFAAVSLYSLAASLGRGARLAYDLKRN